jgi:hypothetical protein
LSHSSLCPWQLVWLVLVWALVLAKVLVLAEAQAQVLCFSCFYLSPPRQSMDLYHHQYLLFYLRFC